MNYALIVGGVLSFLASLMHIAVIYVGADGYRLFGAGEESAMMAGVLFVWAPFAFSGAGLMRRMPMLKLG